MLLVDGFIGTGKDQNYKVVELKINCAAYYVDVKKLSFTLRDICFKSEIYALLLREDNLLYLI